ncbi:hypothetical protein, partial [Methanothrix soehngenii]|uniref:hypothetical protein n=1 Tax=Methanothrix soehngenii TaxID=2223 RepID=UPI00300CDFBC
MCGTWKETSGPILIYLNLLNASLILLSSIHLTRRSQSYEPVSPLSVVGETGNRPRVKILFDPQDEAEAAAKYILSIVGQQFDFVKREQ